MSGMKSCPFCGGDSVTWQSLGDHTRAGCVDCGAEVTRPMGLYRNAMIEWNTRPIEDELRKRIAELEDQLEDWTNNGWAYDLDEYKGNPEVQKCTTNSIKITGAKMNDKFTEDFIKEQLGVMEKFEKADCSPSPEYIAGRNAAIQNYPDALRKILLLEHEIRSWCRDMRTVFDDGKKRVIEAERKVANLHRENDALQARSEKAESMVERLIGEIDKHISGDELTPVEAWYYGKLPALVAEWKEREE